MEIKNENHHRNFGIDPTRRGPTFAATPTLSNSRGATALSFLSYSVNTEACRERTIHASEQACAVRACGDLFFICSRSPAR
jgi:hypothetical protein